MFTIPFAFFDNKYNDNNGSHLFFATATKVFDSFLMTYIFAINLCFAILKNVVYFHFGEKNSKIFQSIKKYFGRVESEN